MRLAIYINKSFSEKIFSSKSEDCIVAFFKAQFLSDSEQIVNCVKHFFFEESDIKMRNNFDSFADSCYDTSIKYEYTSEALYNLFNYSDPQKMISFKKFEKNDIVKNSGFDTAICLFDEEKNGGCFHGEGWDTFQRQTGFLCISSKVFEELCLRNITPDKSNKYKDERLLIDSLGGVARGVYVCEEHIIGNLIEGNNYDDNLLTKRINFLYKAYFKNLDKSVPISINLFGRSRVWPRNASKNLLFFLNDSEIHQYNINSQNFDIRSQKQLLRNAVKRLVGKILKKFIDKLSAEGHSNFEIKIILALEALLTIESYRGSGKYRLPEKIDAFFHNMHQSETNRVIRTNRLSLEYGRNPFKLPEEEKWKPKIKETVSDIIELMTEAKKDHSSLDALLMKEGSGSYDYCVAKYPDDQSSTPQTP